MKESTSVDPSPRCPGCGTPLASGTLDGLCPACLLGDAMTPTEDPATSDSPRPVAPSLEAVRAAFPHLEVLGLIGCGGMGAVFKARQPQLDRLIALKIIPAAHPAHATDFAARFEREGRLLARLHHPNIVTVHDSGRAGDFYYLVMEYVEGVTLREAMRAARFTPAQALALVPKICEALQYAHEEGILHRDIKPENILLDTRGRVKLADFGIAKLMAREPAAAPSATEPPPVAPAPALTQAGATLGTPHYMAPEQAARPEEVDHRADIYSLGVVFYELLTGELPPAPFAPPSSRAAVDRRIDAIVRQALEKERALRQHSAAELKTQVESATASGGESLSARPAGRSFQSWEYVSRRHLFGLPLVHVTRGEDPATGKCRVACGVIAIGDVAKGVFAFGGRAYGGVAFGGIAVGVVAIGGVAVGLISLGGLALALLLALGGVSVGALAVGGMAIGWQAVGGSAYGYGVAGGSAKGVHVYGWRQELPDVLKFLMFLSRQMVMTNLFVWVAAVLSAIGLTTWAKAKAFAAPGALPSGARVTEPRSPWWGRAGALCWVAAIPFLLGSLVWLHLLGLERGGWHPALGEALLVSGTWLGAVLFPTLGIGFSLVGQAGARRSASLPAPRRAVSKLALLLLLGLPLAVLVAFPLAVVTYLFLAWEKPSSPSPAHEAWIAAARREVEVVKARHQAGVANPADVIAAETKLAVAEANGAPLLIARAERNGAARQLELARQRWEAGAESQEVVEQLRAKVAALEAEIARLER